MKTHGTAVWQGGIKDGKGAISTKSGPLKDYPYGFSSRFEGKPGTNPEELIGAETGDERRENLRRSVQRQAPKGSSYCAAEFLPALVRVGSKSGKARSEHIPSGLLPTSGHR